MNPKKKRENMSLNRESFTKPRFITTLLDRTSGTRKEKNPPDNQSVGTNQSDRRENAMLIPSILQLNPIRTSPTIRRNRINPEEYLMLIPKISLTMDHLIVANNQPQEQDRCPSMESENQLAIKTFSLHIKPTNQPLRTANQYREGKIYPEESSLKKRKKNRHTVFQAIEFQPRKSKREC